MGASWDASTFPIIEKIQAALPRYLICVMEAISFVKIL
ncbi:Uncharacterized [Syntrophomonas zehnderi OL-4]|uniref:Uncharacterized n=1 Tax=Syntrophomonas zehnderi OL-4 TaxID=690567 RepID=A0A0E3W3X1_9FIRM|nr:Uncharacterized [Syntrophomonas zehnderi OL-4]